MGLQALSRFVSLRVEISSHFLAPRGTGPSLLSPYQGTGRGSWGEVTSVSQEPGSPAAGREEDHTFPAPRDGEMCQEKPGCRKACRDEGLLGYGGNGFSIGKWGLEPEGDRAPLLRCARGGGGGAGLGGGRGGEARCPGLENGASPSLSCHVGGTE